MQDSPEARSGTTGRIGRRLLLLLALAACGGEGGGDAARDAPAAQGGPARTAADKGPGGGPACEPSPAVDPAFLSDTTPWGSFAQWRESAGVGFKNTSPEHTIADVALCPTCNSVRIRIVSDSTTYCNSVEDFDSTRIAGVWVVEEGTVTPPDWGRSFGRNDSIFLFARDSTATLVYKVGDRVHLAPRDSWRFRYCVDGRVPTGPQGEWRDTISASGSRPNGKGKDKDKGGDGEDPGTYGWMACASGCCQFYIPPGQGQGAGRFPPCPDLEP